MAESEERKVNIDFSDQRTGGTEISADLDRLYILADKAGIPDGIEVRIRLRSEIGPYGYTKKIGPKAYRVVINIRNPKAKLSDGAQYVVNNTLLHELRHVAQGEASGWHTLTGDYSGWSETEAREYGRTIKGQSEFFALV